MFKVGDKVKIIDDFDGLYLKGKHGNVVVTYENLSYLGIEFNTMVGGHSLRGRVQEGFGYNVPIHMCKLIPQIWRIFNEI